MPGELEKFFQDLDLEQLRFRRPSKFIFFCGGAASLNAHEACSMRHYLLNDRQIGPRLKAGVVLAEKANQLYRDTNYTDLISFEEDIAKISTMVLVIVESPGSFAEVGAFSANSTIRKSLTILMQEKYAEGESFIRFGPVERIKKDDPDRVAFFPWRINGKNNIIKSSARSHVADIIRFINNQVTRIPREQKFTE